MLLVKHADLYGNFPSSLWVFLTICIKAYCLLAAAFAVLALTTSITQADEPEPNKRTFNYQASMGPLVAGTLDFEFLRTSSEYQLLGRFLSSQSLSAYYTWTGAFAANGEWVDQAPVTQTYLVQSESTDDDYKVVVMGPTDSQVILGRDGDFETIPRPAGVDLISALMFTPQCFDGSAIHDGEDSYPIKLLESRQAKLSRKRGFFSGKVLRCDYAVTSRRGNQRKLRVSMTQIDGIWVAAEVRVRLAIWPDPVFRLRG